MNKKFSVLIKNKIDKFNNTISTIPGCKSTSFRALIFASQLIGPTHLTGVLEGDDIKSCKQSLRDLGVKIIKIRSGEYKIFGNGENSFREPSKKKLYFGNAGTLGILMGFLATSSNINVRISGDKSLNSRSMQKFILPLSRIGCSFIPKNKKNFPLVIQGTDYGLAQHHFLCSGSGQEKAAILNAAINLEGITTIEERKPFSRNHSELMLRSIGAPISIIKKDKYNLISVRGQQNLKGFCMKIPGDSSSAAFFVALTLLTKGSSLTIRKVNLNYFRIGYIRVLQSMGARIKLKNKKIKFNEPVGDIICKYSKLRPIKFPKKEVISTLDELPIMMTIASQIPGISTFKNIEKIRGKESDRVKKMSENLEAFGIKTRVTKNSMKIYGSSSKVYSKNKQIIIKATLDHRIQMCSIILAAVNQVNVLIKGCDAIHTSFPNFLSLLKKLNLKYAIKKN